MPFYPLQVNLSDTGKNEIMVSIVERIENQINQEKSFTIKNIRLQTRNEGVVNKSWATEQFVPPDYKGKDKFYRTRSRTITIGESDSLFLLIDYTQGFTVEKKVNI